MEHHFLNVRRGFGYVQVNCGDSPQNTGRLVLLLGLGNLMTSRRSAGRITEAVGRPKPGIKLVSGPSGPGRGEING